MEFLPLQAAEAFLSQIKSNAFSGTEGVYMLPHHVQEIDRLRRQHRFMKSTTDGALLVTPLPSERKNLCVLDSGCADGLYSHCDLPSFSHHRGIIASFPLHIPVPSH